MTTPAATVLIDTYNHERFIEEAVESALQQDFPASEMEVLVVDDGSTDSTPEIVRKFEPRVRLLRKPNGGQASAFNAGIPEARGEFVAFLDGDDWWARNKLRAVAEAFDKNPGAGTVGHGITEVNAESGVSKTLAPGATGYFDLSNDEGAQTFRNFMAFLGTSRVSIRRSVLERVLPVPEALQVEADEFISTIAVARSGAVLLPDPLTFYRVHDGNLFHFRIDDVVRHRRKMNVMACLAKELPGRLQKEGVSPSAIRIVVEPIRVFVERMHLFLEGGMPWQTYRIERADYRLSYRKAGFAYRAFKELSLLLALVLPPKTYYKIHDWYGANNLRRFRSWLGEPTPVATIRMHGL